MSKLIVYPSIFFILLSLTSLTNGKDCPIVESSLSYPSSRVYEVIENGFTSGVRYYVDRGYVIESLPPYLEGRSFIRTAYSDRRNTSESFMTFEINKSATIYVAYDKRNGVPSWLRSFTYTGDSIRTSDTACNFKVYAKDFPPGEVVLGGNKAPGVTYSRSMYSVIFGESLDCPVLPPAVTDALDAAGINPENTPPEVLAALVAAYETGSLEVIDPSTTVNSNVTLQPGAAIVLGAGASINGKVQGSTDSVIVIGDEGFVNGDITGVELSFIGGSNIEVNGNLQNVGQLSVGPGAEALLKGNVETEIASLILEEASLLTIEGNLKLSERLEVRENAVLDVYGNLICDEEGISYTVEATAEINIGGNNECLVLP